MARRAKPKRRTRRRGAPRLVILAEKLYEDTELWYPLIYFRAKGWHVHVASTEQMPLNGKHGYEITPDLFYKDLRVKDWDAVLVPGGFSPDYVRRNKAALKFVRDMYEKEKIVAAICHATWVLISANIVKGKRVATEAAIYDDVINAGAKLINDKPVVVHKNLITSRGPSDLPFFCDAVDRMVTK